MSESKFSISEKTPAVIDEKKSLQEVKKDIEAAPFKTLETGNVPLDRAYLRPLQVETGNVPLDRVYLRPLQGGIYDTEIYDPAYPAQEITFFGVPIGCFYRMAGYGKKTAQDTNMWQSWALTYPIELSLSAFHFYVEAGASEEDQAQIINGGLFEFAFSGKEPYLQFPLLAWPGRKSLLDTGYVAKTIKLQQEFSQKLEGLSAACKASKDSSSWVALLQLTQDPQKS